MPTDIAIALWIIFAVFLFLWGYFLGYSQGQEDQSEADRLTNNGSEQP